MSLILAGSPHVMARKAGTTRMNIQTLKELQAADERTLRFTPLGLGKMRPEDAADFQQQVMARLHLADDVAETTRQKFEQLRAAFVHGVLCYELFTLVQDAAQLALEQALRDRFAAHHQGGDVEVSDGRGRVRRIPMTTYPDFFELLREVRDPRIRMGASGNWQRFNGMLGGLLTWARREGVRRGQRSRALEPVLQRLRNTVAHGSYHLTSPVEAARALSDLSEIINQLWGHPTPGGRLCPAPVDRDIVALGWTKSGGRIHSARAEDLIVPDDADDLTWVVVRAVGDDPCLFEFDSCSATTAFPAEYLWGPGTRAEAAAWLSHHQPESDQCDYLDQVVLVRGWDGRVHPPVYPAIAAGLPATEQTGTWYALRVDRALDALGHVRAVVSGGERHNVDGECRDCPAETLATGDITTVLDAALHAGAETTPLNVPDARTPFAEWFARSPA